MTCSACGRTFGGVFGYDRHLAHRPVERCRTDAELRRRGIAPGPDGVWRRQPPRPFQLSLFGSAGTGGSRTVEDRARDRRATRARYGAQRRRAQESSGVS